MVFKNLNVSADMDSRIALVITVLWDNYVSKLDGFQLEFAVVNVPKMFESKFLFAQIARCMHCVNSLPQN